MDKKRKKLIEIFMQWNSKINLSAIRLEKEIYTKHILDSIELNKIISFQDGSTGVDFGTGGGFPMLPLAISNPHVRFLGIESKRKKVDAVNDMISQLKLKNAKATWKRLEEYNQKHDYILARAVGHVNKIIDICYKSTKKGGSIILYKQLNFEEDADIVELCDNVKFKLEQRYLYKLFDEDIQRVIYIIKKL